jgi:hypothetical protein
MNQGVPAVQEPIHCLKVSELGVLRRPAWDPSQLNRPGRLQAAAGTQNQTPDPTNP